VETVCIDSTVSGVGGKYLQEHYVVEAYYTPYAIFQSIPLLQTMSQISVRFNSAFAKNRIPKINRTIIENDYDIILIFVKSIIFKIFNPKAYGTFLKNWGKNARQVMLYSRPYSMHSYH
jgi:hypothetical protein